MLASGCINSYRTTLELLHGSNERRIFLHFKGLVTDPDRIIEKFPSFIRVIFMKGSFNNLCWLPLAETRSSVLIAGQFGDNASGRVPQD